jgi:hypothetical protein
MTTDNEVIERIQSLEARVATIEADCFAHKLKRREQPDHAEVMRRLHYEKLKRRALRREGEHDIDE